MEYNQLKQYGVEIHEDTPSTSTPVARMIPSVIDAKYAKLFLASPEQNEALREIDRWLLDNPDVSGDPQLHIIHCHIQDALAKAEGK